MYVRRVCVACGYNGMQWDDVFVTLPSFLTFLLSFFLSLFLFVCLSYSSGVSVSLLSFSPLLPK